MHYRKHPERFPKHILSIPFIYAVLFPTVFLDLIVELYHRTCFPLYGLPLVQRSQYIRIDRQRLSYLKWYEKLNCAYCGYVNGVFFYVSRIAGETENYWCGIKHERINGFTAPAHQDQFLEYGDQQQFEAFVKNNSL